MFMFRECKSLGKFMFRECESGQKVGLPPSILVGGSIMYGSTIHHVQSNWLDKNKVCRQH